MKRFVIVGLLVASILWAAAGAYAESVKLEYRFRKGDTNKYNVAAQFNAKLPNMPGMPNQGAFTMTMSMIQVQKVMAVYPDGTAKLKVWTGDIKMSIPGLPMMPKDSPPSSTVYMKMSKLGTVLSMDMPELTAALKKAGKNGNKSGVPGLSGMPGMPGMDMKSMNSMIGQYSQYGAFPAEAVEVGAPWKRDVPLPMGLGTMTITNTVTSASEQFAGSTAAKITRVLEGHIDLTQILKLFSEGFARGFNGATAQTGKEKITAPEMSGTVDIAGSTADYFSTELGKLMGTTGAGTATIVLKLPPQVAQGGIPPDMNIVIDGSMTMTKI